MTRCSLQVSALRSHEIFVEEVRVAVLDSACSFWYDLLLILLSDSALSGALPLHLGLRFLTFDLLLG